MFIKRTHPLGGFPLLLLFNESWSILDKNVQKALFVKVKVKIDFYKVNELKIYNMK